MSEKISTSALAKMRKVEAKLLFADLKRAGYIVRQDEKWILTEEGAKFGGEYVDHPKFGQFIVWPTNLHIELTSSSGKTLSATLLGEKLKLNAKRMNQLLSELGGWIAKSEEGWSVTEAGIRAGGQQRTDKETQNTFVVWHDVVLRNKRLKQSVIEFLGQDAESHSTDKSYSSFRQKFEAKHRTLDGHYVRSKGGSCSSTTGCTWLVWCTLMNVSCRLTKMSPVIFICQAVKSIYSFGGEVILGGRWLRLTVRPFVLFMSSIILTLSKSNRVN